MVSDTVMAMQHLPDSHSVTPASSNASNASGDEESLEARARMFAANIMLGVTGHATREAVERRHAELVAAVTAWTPPMTVSTTPHWRAFAAAAAQLCAAYQEQLDDAYAATRSWRGWQ